MDHFNILELDIKIHENVKEVLAKIEECLSDFQVEIKQIKRLHQENEEEVGETIHIIGHYNKKGFKKNELLRNITSIENVEEIIEE